MHLDFASPPPSVLSVEDEILIAEELSERLSRFGFFVIGTVDSAEEAIEIAINERPNLVLMDIRLRGKQDGIDATEEIRRQVDVPIVYLTAYSDRLTVERAKKTDDDGFILKPSHKRELQSTIEVAMQRHALRTCKSQ